MQPPPTTICPSCKTANQPQAAFCRACGYALHQSATPSAFNTGTGQLLSGTLLKQRYHVLHPIGQGGMGAVYEAEDNQLGNRKVALKEMRQSGLNPQEITNAANAFRQEALLLASLQNPHLPNIYDHFSEFNRWYLVMSFIHGETLEEYLRKASDGKLSVAETLQISIQLCTVLSYLHTQQPPIIFRDLKPTNIMRTADGHIYLIDFGIARLFKPGQAKDTSSYASMGYASPEQYGKSQTTQQSDIYSLGVVIHQLLTGYHPSRTPFRFPPLQTPGQALPPELVTLVEQMHHLDENIRPASMLIVKQKLQSIAAPPAPSQVTPAPAPSLPPTIPANTPPAVVTPTPTPAPKPPVPIPPVKPVRTIGVWSLSKQRLLAMLIGIAIYGTADHFLPLLSIASIPLFTIALLIPLFFASKFGPWVGLTTALLGLAIGDITSLGPTIFSFSWPYYLGIALLGLLAGSAIPRTQAGYTTWKALRFAMLMSFIGLLVFELSFLIDLIRLSTNPGVALFIIQPWYALIPLLLLLILLFITDKIGHRNAKP